MIDSTMADFPLTITHLDFKRHTGVTPSAYVAAQKPYIDPDGPGEYAGFVPDL